MVAFLSSVFRGACLLRARAPLKTEERNQPIDTTSTAGEMIVAASCGTKNNNASLQSNN